jgi:hypothetical protein
MTRCLKSARETPISRWPARTRSCMATALAAALLTGVVVPQVAESANFDPTTTPLPDRIYAGCQLDTSTGGTVHDLNSALEGGHEIAFVVVYSLNNDNDGQPLVNVSGSVTGFTGPVICVNPDIAAIANTTQTSSISGVDTLDIENAFILRYTDSTTKKSLCRTVDTNTECYQISPSSGTAPDWVGELQADIQDGQSSIGTPEIAFVVVHALTVHNGGSVVLANNAVASFPTPTSTPPTISATATLDAEDAFVLAYRPSGSTSGDKKVICHTVNANTDCFQVSSP